VHMQLQLRLRPQTVEKVGEKKNDPVWIKGVQLIDLSDCEVPNKKLQCNSDDIDDEEVPNPNGMDVGNDTRSCLQTLEPDLGMATEPVPIPLGIHSEPLSKVSAAIMDPLFNAARKVPLPNAIIIKHEAGWFQLWEEKW
jgi:hypothetical protein